MQLWWWKKFACHKKNLAWLPSEGYLCYLSLTCSPLNSLNKVCMSVTRCFAELDVLALLLIMDLKHRLHTGFVVSVGLPLLSATTVKALCVYFFNKPRTVGRSTHATFSHVCLALLCDCHCETTPTLSAGSEEAERSCTRTHCPAVAQGS